MKWSSWRYILGGALVLMGALTLLQVLGYIPTSGNVVGVIFGVLFLALGISFLTVFGAGRQNWWAAIPGTVLVFLGLLVLFGVFTPRLADRWGGPFFLAGISLAFWLVYFMAPQNWWAIIPGGVLLTLAAVAALPESGDFAGGLFFLGMALTFFVLWLIPVNGRRMTWPWIPGAVLAVMGLIVLFASTNLFNYVWPALLILAGLVLLVRAYWRRA